MNTQELITKMKEEVELMKSINIERIDFEEGKRQYNVEDKISEVVYFKSKDLIKDARLLKETLENEPKYISEEFVFNLNKIHSYADLIEVWFDKRSVKMVRHNDIYNEYKKEISDIYAKLNHNDVLNIFLNRRYIKVYLEFSINNKLKDIDNIIKPFIDCLFFNANSNDNLIYELDHKININSKKIMSSNDFESVKLRIETLTQLEIEKTN